MVSLMRIQCTPAQEEAGAWAAALLLLIAVLLLL